MDDICLSAAAACTAICYDKSIKKKKKMGRDQIVEKSTLSSDAIICPTSSFSLAVGDIFAVGTVLTSTHYLTAS